MWMLDKEKEELVKGLDVEVFRGQIARRLLEQMVDMVAKEQLQKVADGPFKRTTIGLERSMPEGTAIRFLTEEEWEVLQVEAYPGKENPGG